MSEPRPLPASEIDPATAEQSSRFRLARVDWLLMASVLLMYAVTRLWALEDFPIYFFCDEAHQANLAQDLVANGLRDEYGRLFPAYFRNVRVFNLGLSVWLHALPVTVLGKTVFVVRATSVLVGMFGAAALMLALKWFYGIRLWWTGGLVMAALPAWFLHSRTAFETAMMVGFYAAFVLAYLLYREVSAWWLTAAVVCGAGTFYSYANGQGVMFITCLLLLLVDWRHHWRVLRHHRAAAAAGVVALVLVAAPYLHFRFVLHPEMMSAHLEDLHSYWTEDLPIARKLETFASTYLRGLSPGYWFVEDLTDLDRHRMLGYPHLPLWLAPAVLLGLGVSLARSPRSAPHRLVLVAVLAAPFSASLVALRITRVLAMIVPATVLAAIGLDRLRAWLARVVPERVFGVAVGLGLACAAGAMTRDALVNGPRWFSDYGMYGMQWGAKELFAVLRELLAADPGERFVISHSWANNSNSFAEFFLTPEERARVSWLVIDEVLRERRREVAPATSFVLTHEEFVRARESPKLRIVRAGPVIPDPSGRPGFHIVRLAYAPGADAIFEAEREERQRLVEGTVTIDGGLVRVRHPRLDMGEIQDAFDGDPGSLARTLDANPTRLEILFPGPRAVRELRLHLWTELYKVGITAIRADGTILHEAVQADTRRGSGLVTIRLRNPAPDVVELRLTISKSGDVHVHLRGIEILP